MKRFTKIRLIALAVVFGLLVPGAFFLFGLPYFLYSAVENWVTSRLGFDFYLARLLATIFVIVLTALSPMLAWYLIFGKRRLYGVLALIGIQAAVCLLVYTVGANVCFDRRTGKPLCRFADTERGRVWSYTPGFEPVGGKPFRLYTREIKESEEQERVKRKGLASLPKIIRGLFSAIIKHTGKKSDCRKRIFGTIPKQNFTDCKIGQKLVPECF